MVFYASEQASYIITEAANGDASSYCIGSSSFILAVISGACAHVRVRYDIRHALDVPYGCLEWMSVNEIPNATDG